MTGGDRLVLGISLAMSLFSFVGAGVLWMSYRDLDRPVPPVIVQPSPVQVIQERTITPTPTPTPIAPTVFPSPVPYPEGVPAPQATPAPQVETQVEARPQVHTPKRKVARKVILKCGSACRLKKKWRR